MSIHRQPFKKDACAICGKAHRSERAIKSGVGDRCRKAVSKLYPELLDEDGNIIRDRITPDIQFDVMKAMREERGVGKRVCICIDDETGEIEVDGVPIDVEDVSDEK